MKSRTESLKRQEESELPEFARLALCAEHPCLGLQIIVWANGKLVAKQP